MYVVLMLCSRCDFEVNQNHSIVAFGEISWEAENNNPSLVTVISYFQNIANRWEADTFVGTVR